jgi:hypothetical protein
VYSTGARKGAYTVKKVLAIKGAKLFCLILKNANKI